MPKTNVVAPDTSWFVHDRFGLFIHWGTYALAARHEWVKHNEQIPDGVYEKYFKHFDPDLYDPQQWADAAANAGMKYFVITTKHHEGFCLWDSKLTDYNATNTPCGRDLIKPMAEAFRAKGLHVGFYHSLIDWHHPHFVIDNLHSMRNHPDRAKMNESRDQKQYAKYLHGQVRELLTKYGKVDVLFYDFSYPVMTDGRPDTTKGKGRDDWESEKLIAMTRKLQPGIIVNDRLNLEDAPGGWDIKTPEQFMPREWVKVDGKPVVWETCQTFSGSWGYHRDEASWKSVGQLLRMLIEVVSKGGNLLLNVGPTGRGEFDERAMDRLRGMGEWMKRHSRSIYGCTSAPVGFLTPQDCRLTWNPESRRMYLHVFAWPFRHLHMDGFAGKVAYAQLLNDASEIRFNEKPGDAAKTLTLDLPVCKPNVEIPVIELYMKD
ncbi:MAG TPA: alpha-L-fucosidase [Candidatus Brocadiia bacterium]|nr:alpha-L-fucosidase [Candidatus Brocadiia bacterium]